MAKVGDIVGNYRVIEEIASGTFGRVYRGQHAILTNRIVAIKLMHGIHLNSQKERDNFIQEARLLEILKHLHILSIIDVGFHEGFPYIVTEYATNGSLRDRLKRLGGKPLPVEVATTIISQIGEALQYAHQQQKPIIHRDLKPENILFNAKGEALLADFGIATVLGSLSIQQATITGTPPYMAPEQFKGEISKESDQYALGCIAYELFTGRQPFTAPDIIAMMTKHLMEQPTPPTQINSNLPLHIGRAILKAMAKQRADRYTAIIAFITALRKTKEQWLSEGNAHYRKKRYVEALIAFEQAIQLDPNDDSAHTYKGDALYDLQRYEEALSAHERVIRLNPNFAYAYQYKGLILEHLGRKKEARQAFEKAKQLGYKG